MLTERLEKELKEVYAKGLRRTVDGLRFKTAVCAEDGSGREYLVFASNNYLGLTHEPEVMQAARNAVCWGTGSTGSRLTTGAAFATGKLERELAEFKHAEKALVFNTGYMTNLGVLYALVKPGDVVFSDELNHASIIDGCRIARAKVVVYRHNDMQHLEELLKTTPVQGVRFIVTDGVFSMDGDIVSLPQLVELKEKYNACLIVDDAHAVGVIGGDGSGTAAYYNLQGKVDVQIGTLSKALAAEGGYVAANSVIIEYLINKARPFIFSTALPDMVTASALAALRLLKAQPQKYLGRLKENTLLMRRLLKEECLDVIDGVTPIVPVLIGSTQQTMQFMAALMDAGIMVSGIRPPTVPEGTSRLRVTVTAAHTAEEIEVAARTMGKIWRQMNEDMKEG